MSNRSKENVLEEKGGINFTTESGIRGMLKIHGEDRVRVYQNPPVPKGYKYLCGEKYKGWTIERISDKSQALWLPIESLDADGSLDGINFTEKLGRRTCSEHFTEPLTGELFDQIISCRKYGGIYIFKYPISINPDTNKPQSVKLTDDSSYMRLKEFVDASSIARKMDSRPDGSVKSHLVYMAEWESLLTWLEMSGVELDESWDRFKWTQGKYYDERATYGKLWEREKNRYAIYNRIPTALTIL